MKNFLKKHFAGGSNQSEDSEGGSTSSSSKGINKFIDGERLSSSPANKSFSTISGWLNSVTNRSSPSPSPPSSSNVNRGERIELESISSLDAALEAVRQDSEESGNVEEEYQIQLALELSAREDPEAVQIEAVKQISLGSCPSDNNPAEVVAYRYWNYDALSYDDKILDGFYDLYGMLTEPTSTRMPSLVDLQVTPISDNISWEAILVNKESDPKLLNLEQKALEMAFKVRSHNVNSVTHLIVQKLASLVSEHMGGPVGDPNNMLVAWRNLSHSLKSKHGSMVLPLGSLDFGLARHRALLFKVLADSLGIPCRLVKGEQYTGSADVAMIFVKIDGGREYIVDLMSDPGTLIPSDAAVGAQMDSEDSLISSSHMPKDVDTSSPVASSNSVINSSFKDSSDYGTLGKLSKFKETNNNEKESAEVKKPSRFNPYSHARSPSWTEGVSSPAVRRMQVKDVSQYMIDAAKENPQLAQKLHDVLLESGVVAPPNLFTEVYPEQFNIKAPSTQEKEKKGTKDYINNLNRAFLPPLPPHGFQSRVKTEQHHVSSEGSVLSHQKGSKDVDVAAAAAAAAVVASSMVVAAAKTNSDAKGQLPVAAAATATVAAVVATTAAVNKQHNENSETSPDSPASIFVQSESVRNDGEADGSNLESERKSDKSTGNESSKSDVSLVDVEDCEIPLEDITLGDRIGLGSYGEVYHGEWHGTEVAVKKFLDQDITGESLEEFKTEVWIMKKVRHPNVVLFMGAITRPPNLSIVTEFLPRGSLYRLIHRPNNQLDERRRLRMALDAARGMNYLHNCTPMIVHRDLKSPNLLVDKNWVVKVCDFGLSRMKNSTFLSSRSTAGTAEWMAPEVLRNEPSNEKCDVFSFGVVLWELCTLKQPWGGLNPMQVVGAVGFQHRRLDIPDNMDPAVADIINKCWQTDPNLRPSFAEIMAALKPLQKTITSSQVPRPVSNRNSLVNVDDQGTRKS